MHLTLRPRIRVLVGSILLSLTLAITAAASVLADGAGGSFPH